jgi:dinuclear metal center YbgI/SA1388 family protein
MIASDIIAHLESFAPVELQESYDNSGLLVGDPSTEVKGALITLDVTEDVVDEAIRTKCNLIIAHHPLIFSGLKRITGKTYVERTVIKAIKHDILIYAAHTNLDNVFEGVNNRICTQLGLKNLKILSEKKFILKRLIVFAPDSHAEEIRMAMFKAGAGHIGNYDECSFNSTGTGMFRPLDGSNPFSGKKGVRSEEEETKIETIFPGYLQDKVIKAMRSVHPYEEVAYDIIPLENSFQKAGSGMVGELETEMDESAFLELLKSEMKAEGIRYTALRGKKVKKVAVCGGSGSFLLKDAMRAGADVFVTGDFKYHQFFDADNRILIADIGHFESEQYTVNLLAELVQKKFPTFAVRLSETRTNPIYYL